MTQCLKTPYIHPEIPEEESIILQEVDALPMEGSGVPPSPEEHPMNITTSKRDRTKSILQNQQDRLVPNEKTLLLPQEERRRSSDYRNLYSFLLTGSLLLTPMRLLFRLLFSFLLICSVSEHCSSILSFLFPHWRPLFGHLLNSGF